MPNCDFYVAFLPSDLLLAAVSSLQVGKIITYSPVQLSESPSIFLSKEWGTPHSTFRESGISPVSIGQYRMQKGIATPLNIECFKRLPQAGDRITPLPRCIFVCYITAVVKFSDSTRNESVIQLLIVIELVASRISGGVNMLDPLNVVTNGLHDVSILDLHVVYVVEDADSR